MSKLVPPHGGGELKPLLAPVEDRNARLDRAAKLTVIPMTTREVSDVLMFALGAYTPLEGFMSEADWRGSCVDMALADGTFWPIPVTLSASEKLAEQIENGQEVALTDAETGDIMAVMTVTETYAPDKSIECESVYKTTDEAHPGVASVLRHGPVYLAGPVTVLNEGDVPEQFSNLYLSPAESRAVFEEKGWSRVAAFQTRNPMHRSHEHLVGHGRVGFKRDRRGGRRLVQVERDGVRDEQPIGVGGRDSHHVVTGTEAVDRHGGST